MRIGILVVVAVAALGLMAGAASAHTISIGTFNAGAPGSVTIAMGTYNHFVNFAQGSIELVSGPGIPPTVGPIAFGGFTLTKPAGLIDGVNNFFAPSSGGSLGQYDQPAPVGVPPEHNWQSVTFTGLSAGTYTYQLTGMVDVNWADWNTGASNWRGTLEIPESSVAPEPASLLLLGLGLSGFAALRRRRRSA